ncbi:MAG: hypothetical protein Alpg2KO_11790 [Alphaproteobacteria bacterium]
MQLPAISNKVRNFFSRGIKLALITGGMALAAWTAVSGTYLVGPGQEGFEMRNGQVVERTGYGPQWANPWTTESYVMPTGDRGGVITRVDTIDKAGDHAGLIFSVGYKITAEDPGVYRVHHRGIRSDLDDKVTEIAKQLMQADTKAEMGKIVPGEDRFDGLVSKVRAELEKHIAEKGYEIELTRVSAPRGWELPPNWHRCSFFKDQLTDQLREEWFCDAPETERAINQMKISAGEAAKTAGEKPQIKTKIGW